MNKKFVTLAAALLLGAASAQQPQTPQAGTEITNKAYAYYEDPNDPTKTSEVPSNPVTTTVTAVPDYSIVYSKPDGGEDYLNSDKEPGQEGFTPVDTKEAKTGETVEFKYEVVNDGNAPITKVTFDTNTYGGVDSSTINYTSTDGEFTKEGDKWVFTPNNPIQPGERVDFTQTYKVPDVDNTKGAGADPVGTEFTYETGEGNQTATKEDKDADNYNQVKEPELKGNFKFAKFVSGSKNSTTAAYDELKVPNLPGWFKEVNDYGTEGSKVKPGEELNYLLFAKNDYNEGIENFYVCDTVPENTEFKGIEDAFSNGNGYEQVNTIYKVGNGTWDTTKPQANLAAGTKVCVAMDDDAAGFNPAPLPAGAQYLVEYSVTVNGEAPASTEATTPTNAN